MVFNTNQFKQKKKRVMNPDIVRPNLFSHEKKLKDSQATIDQLQNQVDELQSQIMRMKSKYEDMQSSISMLIAYMRKNK